MNASSAMLALKLVLVPGFLLLVTLAARRWGPSFGGWLAGLPAARLQAVTGDACRRWHRDCVPLPPPGLHRPGTRHPVGAADPRRCRVGPT